jgi:hypothetical protein
MEGAMVEYAMLAAGQSLSGIGEAFQSFETWNFIAAGAAVLVVLLVVTH